MAFTHGSVATLTINGSAFTTYLTDAGLDRKTDDAETSTLGNTFKTYIPGLESGEFKLKGEYDPTVDGYINAIGRTIVAFVYRPQGAGTGLIEYTGNCFRDDFKISSPVKNETTFEAKFQITGTISRAVQS